jgi:hypothetical protein
MMTSFGIRVKFSDSEMDLLQKALDHYLNVWRREFRKGNGAAYSVSIKRFRMTSKAELKYGRGVSMDEGQIAAVQRVLQTYLEACQIPGGPGVTVRERRIDQEDQCDIGARAQARGHKLVTPVGSARDALGLSPTKPHEAAISAGCLLRSRYRRAISCNGQTSCSFALHRLARRTVTAFITSDFQARGEPIHTGNRCRQD